MALEFLLAAALVSMLHGLYAEDKANERRTAVIASATKISGLIHDVGVALMRQLASSGASYQSTVSDLTSELSRLKELVRDDPKDLALCEHLEKQSNDGADMMLDFVFRVKSLTIPQKVQVNARLAHISSDSVAITTHIIEKYSELAKEASKHSEARWAELHQLMFIGGALNIGIALVLLLRFSRSLTKRMSAISKNSVHLANGEALAPPLSGSDELAALDLALHSVAQVLQDYSLKQQAIIENSSDVIFALDASGRFQRVSPVAQQLWGYTPDSLLGKDISTLLDSSEQEEIMRNLKLAVDGKTVAPFECKMIHSSGEERFFLWSARWSVDERVVFCVAHDLTDRKRERQLLAASEARQRSLFDSLPVGLLTLDTNGVIEEENSAALSMLDASVDKFNGKRITELFSPLQKGEASGATHSASDEFQILIEQLRMHSVELRAHRISGAEFYAEAALTPMSYENTEKLLLNFQDVSQRHEIEQLKKDFIQMISHDLRTPLTAIDGSITMVLEGVYGTINKKGNERLGQARVGIERLIRLIGDLLDLEKLEEGRLSISPVPVEITGIIGRCIEAVRGFAEQQRVTISVNTERRFVCADPDRIEQVLINLLSNAIKFSRRDSNIEVSVQSEGGSVRLHVDDTGPGVPVHERKRIFEKFKQLDESTDTRVKGSGLGLAICKALVDAHGGEIGVEAASGGGSSFWFTVPACEDPRK